MPQLVLPPPLPDSLPPDRVIGITTTVPIEVIYAAGLIPVDLNNLFITSADPMALAEQAERAAFPRTSCCGTKGIYGAVRQFGIRRVLGVARGDCSSAQALLEVLQHEGTACLTFSFPEGQDVADMAMAIEALAEALGADVAEAERWRERLVPARALASRIDELSWQEGKAAGLENHLWLVSASDFCADPERYRASAEAFVAAASVRPSIEHRVRLGLCGIPPIVPELYGFVEEMGALVVFNETQRQFAMLGPARSLAEQYSRYTYPYGVFPRVEDIRRECGQRRLDGVIHYVQSFCHRRIEDRILRERLPVPVLTLEGDQPEPLSGQLRTRLEAFVQMLMARKRRRAPR